MRANIFYCVVIVVFLLFISSSAMDTSSIYYGETHKMIFNNPDNCIFCHLYDENTYKAIEGQLSTNIPPQSINDMVNNLDTSLIQIGGGYEDEGGAAGGFGWFFGGLSSSSEESNELQSYVNNSYNLSGFVDKEYIIPHEFSSSIVTTCLSGQCHTRGELGNSHAVNVSPYNTYPNMQVALELPLNWDTDKFEEILTCGTCHNPHIDWLSRVKSYDIQQPYKVINGANYYKTHYLRIQDPVRGYYTLCKSCHGAGY